MNHLGASTRLRKPMLLLSTIILIAIGLRLWGIGYDLPSIYHPDEPAMIFRSLGMLKTGDLNPHFFHWPSLPFYLNLLAYVPYYLLGKMMGAFGTPNDILAPVQLAAGVVRTQMPTTVLVGRLVTTSFGIGSVVLVFLIGRRLTNNDWVGILAALMMAVSPTNVWHSRWTTPDMFAVFFVLATILASIWVYQEGRTWQYILAGICVGLAAASKYNAALVVTSLLAAHFLRDGWKGVRDGKLYLALASSGLAFLFSVPFSVLDFPKFFADLKFDSQHYATGHAGMEGNTLQWYLSYLLRMTGAISALAVLAILGGILSRSKEVVLLGAFPIVYSIFISRFVVRNDRTLLPLIPLLFLLASILLMVLFTRATKLRSAAGKVAMVAALSLLLVSSLGPLIYNTLRSNLKLSTVDSRETARIWIEDSLPEGANIAIESYSPFVDPTRFRVQGFAQMIEHTPDWYMDEGYEYLIFSEGMFGRFYADPERYEAQVSKYDRFFQELRLLREFADGGYHVRIYQVMAR